MERKGKKLAVLADGHPRRLADGRNAWRKMNTEQRREYVLWLTNPDEPSHLTADDIAPKACEALHAELERLS